MAKHLTVSEFMSTNISSVRADAELPEILDIMKEKAISCLVIIDHQTNAIKPLGLITERSILYTLAEQSKLQIDKDNKAIDVAEETLVTIYESDSLYEAMVLCRSQNKKHLVVLNENNTLSGIITYSDLIDANYLQLEMQTELIGCDAHLSTVELNAQLMAMTLTDPLLKIGNRRSMEIDILQTHELAVRYNKPYCIALIDIDYFKKYNDNYGHQAGDDVLIKTADFIKGFIRSKDRLYRYGGEEFLWLMAETDLDGADKASQRLVEEIYALGYSHEHSPFQKITASIGFATYCSKTNTKIIHEPTTCKKSLYKKVTKDVIKAADVALYEAKSSGRNQVKFGEAV